MKRREQPQGDLGHKMAATVTAAFEEGHDACIIVGADVPGIGVGHVRFALEASESTNHESDSIESLFGLFGER